MHHTNRDQHHSRTDKEMDECRKERQMDRNRGRGVKRKRGWKERKSEGGEWGEFTSVGLRVEGEKTHLGKHQWNHNLLPQMAVCVCDFTTKKSVPTQQAQIYTHTQQSSVDSLYFETNANIHQHTNSHNMHIVLQQYTPTPTSMKM